MKIKISVHKNIAIIGMIISAVALTVMTSNSTKGTPTHIVINELYYDHQNLQEPMQWVEIYNPTDSPINISGWILAFNSTDGANIFPSNIMIDPGEYLIVTHDEQAFETNSPYQWEHKSLTTMICLTILELQRLTPLN